jgi:heavy metal sensor kinase
MISRYNHIWRSLRFRLVGWYALLLLLTLVLFSVYIFFQFRQLQQGQQDSSLQAAASGARALVDLGGANRPEGSRPPDFSRPPDPSRPITSGEMSLRQAGPGTDTIIPDLARRNVQLRLYNRDGNEVGKLGSSVAEMPVQKLGTQSGFVTLASENNTQWRVFTQPVMERGNLLGWLQVGQPVNLLDAQLGSLFTPILLGALMALILAVVGGLFLASRALRPIDRVTRTAQAISTQDLARRINYEGPQDEIGRLAKTLDQMLDRLEKGFEQERRFTSDASHELRTPLTALKGRLEVTLSRPRSPEEYRQTLGDLSGEVERLVRLSNSLLYLARLDQAGQSKHAENLNLSDLLESIVDSMQPVAELKEIELSGKFPANLEIQGNLDQLTRLFLNLVDNAIKYTPAGGRVTLGVNKMSETKRVEVTVTDTGHGIAAHHLPHLFERFYRVDADRASESGGAGLGLAIASEIARQHGGALDVESTPGQGTTMRVTLPMKL